MCIERLVQQLVNSNGDITRNIPHVYVCSFKGGFSRYVGRGRICGAHIDAGGAPDDYGIWAQSSTAVCPKWGMPLLFGVLESPPGKQLKQWPDTTNSSLKFKARMARVKTFQHIHFSFALLYVNTFLVRTCKVDMLTTILP